MLLTGALLDVGRAACKGKHTATGSMFEGLDVIRCMEPQGE